MTHTRRDFLWSVGALGAAIPIARAHDRPPPRPNDPPTPSAASTSTAHRAIRKSLKFGMIEPGSSLAEKFAVALACGFDGVEMDCPNPFDPAEVVEASRSTGLEIPGVVNSRHWSRPFSDPDPAVRAEMLDALKRSIEDCKAYGGTSVLLVPAVVNKHVSYADAYGRSQEEIRKAIPLAESLGIDILFENVWNNFLLSPLEAARYVDEFNSTRVGWYFDVGNVVNYGWPEHWIRTLGPRVRKLDVKEFSRQKADKEGRWAGFRVEIGDEEGSCDWPVVMAALRDVHYAGGWASAEVGGGDEARLRDVARRMDRILAM